MIEKMYISIENKSNEIKKKTTKTTSVMCPYFHTYIQSRWDIFNRKSDGTFHGEPCQMTTCSGSSASSTHWWWQDRGSHVELGSSQEQREWMYYRHKRQVAMSRELGGGWSKCRQNEQKKKTFMGDRGEQSCPVHESQHGQTKHQGSKGKV